jgi:hypothetical protein
MCQLHSVIDPLGFALENFDAIGGWREQDEDRSRGRRTGTTASGARLKARRPPRGAARAAGAVSAHRDREAAGVCAWPPARVLRSAGGAKIVRDAAANDYRWSSIILGIVNSPTFLTRSGPASTN